MSIKDAIFERARHYVSRRRHDLLATELGIPPNSRSDYRTLRAIASIKAHLGRDVDILVDVGAHDGAFALPAFHSFGASIAICFEPIPRLALSLESKLSICNGTLRTCALSDAPGAATFHIHDDSSMSSLLHSDEELLRKEFSTYNHGVHETIEVEVSTLDIELESYLDQGRRFFLKLDTQGNELEVLKGGPRTLESCDGLVTEYMFTSPYFNQASFEEISMFLQQSGFKCAGVMDLRRRRSHRVSAVDFLFLPNARTDGSRDSYGFVALPRG